MISNLNFQFFLIPFYFLINISQTPFENIIFWVRGQEKLARFRGHFQKLSNLEPQPLRNKRDFIAKFVKFQFNPPPTKICFRPCFEDNFLKIILAGKKHIFGQFSFLINLEFQLLFRDTTILLHHLN